MEKFILNENHQDLRVFADINQVAFEAAKDFAKKAQTAVQNTGSFKVALSGGNTPKLLFDVLASDVDLGIEGAIPWKDIHIFWGDERYVPHENAQSNYRMTMEHLLSRVPVLQEHIYPVPTKQAKPEEAALQYAKTIKKAFQLKADELPVFDLVYLGMGPDGHTASLFPGTDLVEGLVNEIKKLRHALVAALWVPKFNMYRISLLPEVINQATSIVLLVTGADKAPVLNRVICGKYQPLTYPVQLIQAKNGEQVWFVDKAAVSMLDNI